MEGHGNPCVEMLWISQENLAKSTTFPHKAICMFSPNELKQHTNTGNNGYFSQLYSP